ncbi:MARVEL domain-containing protein [Madurella fahalii]|uniref:MARVEL domain-containing protein n=1 Tax=Madurella fahalii TaxID=1157608 RepID=A0ABQ0FZ62_9PEZI
MDVERGNCFPRVRAIGNMGVRFSWAQVAGRSLSILYELGALSFIAWLYGYWRSEPTTRVDILFPSFFPVILGIMVDSYEVVSLLFLDRKRAVNPVSVCFDVAMIGAGIFCFLLLGMVDRGTGTVRGLWATDMTNAMVFMIVFCIIHVGFIVLAAGGVMHIYLSGGKARDEERLARSRAEMIQFNERRRQIGQWNWR